jgi:hypothetical protein
MGAIRYFEKYLDNLEQWLVSKYPTTIVRDRYDGVYSCAPWLAFIELPGTVPPEIFGDDDECAHYFSNERFLFEIIGRGTTPQGALEVLEREVRATLKKYGR